MHLPDEFSPNYIDGGYDSLVFQDSENPGKVIKYYNHPGAFKDTVLFQHEIEEYHAIHQKYANRGPLKGVAIYAGTSCEFSVSVLDLGNDISQVPESKIVITRVPQVPGHHCIIGNVLEAVRITLANNGIPIDVPQFHYEGHHLSPRNVHYTEEEDSKLNIVITDLGASIRESLQFERRLRKSN